MLTLNRVDVNPDKSSACHDANTITTGYADASRDAGINLHALRKYTFVSLFAPIDVA